MASRRRDRLLMPVAFAAAVVLASLVLTQAADLEYIEAKCGSFDTCRYYPTTCRSTGLKVVFSGYKLSFYVKPTIDAVADENTDGGIRMMAAFSAANGTNYTAKEGFDPCLFTTCAGITCNKEGYLLTQEYYNVMDFVGHKLPLRFPGYQEAGFKSSFATVGDPRCTCRDPNNGMKTDFVDDLTVDPAGPSAEHSDAVCAGLVCSMDPDASILYYLTSTDGTPAGCQCCLKQPHIISPHPSYPPSCGAVVPMETTVEPVETTEEPVDTTEKPADTTEEPVPPAETTALFLALVERACPAKALDGSDHALLAAQRDGFCCDVHRTQASLRAVHRAGATGAQSTAQHTTGTSGATERLCGDQLLTSATDAGPASLVCAADLDGLSLRCCGAVDALGGVRTSGHTCKGF